MARVVAGKYVEVPPGLIDDNGADVLWEELYDTETAIVIDVEEDGKPSEDRMVDCRVAMVWRDYEFADVRASRFTKRRGVAYRENVAEP